MRCIEARLSSWPKSTFSMAHHDSSAILCCSFHRSFTRILQFATKSPAVYTQNCTSPPQQRYILQAKIQKCYDAMMSDNDSTNFSPVGSNFHLRLHMPPPCCRVWCWDHSPTTWPWFHTPPPESSTFGTSKTIPRQLCGSRMPGWLPGKHRKCQWQQVRHWAHWEPNARHSLFDMQLRYRSKCDHLFVPQNSKQGPSQKQMSWN